MKKGLIALLVILAIVLIGGCQACSVKNNLVTLDQGVKGKWGEVGKPIPTPLRPDRQPGKYSEECRCA